MDDNFEYFLEKMGSAFDRQYVPNSTIDRYRGKLPDQLLTYWKEYGWCGYADGLFWTVDPQDYEPVLDAWIGETKFMEQDTYHIIARGAFGDLYCWGEKTGFTLKLCSVSSFAVPCSLPIASLEKEIQWFFGSCDREENDFEDYFAPALKKHGKLTAKEMYGFVPAMAMGGSGEFEQLRKVSAIEHLVFLAQLSDLKVLKTASSGSVLPD
jgi:hypothetical protein